MLRPFAVAAIAMLAVLFVLPSQAQAKKWTIDTQPVQGGRVSMRDQL